MCFLNLQERDEIRRKMGETILYERYYLRVHQCLFFSSNGEKAFPFPLRIHLQIIRIDQIAVL